MPVAPRPSLLRCWAASLAVASLLAAQPSSLRAAQDAGPNAAAAPLEPLLVLDAAAMPRWLAHPLDAGLARALAMLPARLAELPEEIPGYEGPDGATLALLARTLLEQPQRLAVALQGVDPETGQPRVVVALDVGVRDEADARTLQAVVTQLLGEAGLAAIAPADEDDDLLEVMTPLGPVRFGPTRGAAGAWRWSLRLGQAVDAEALFAALGRDAADASQLLRVQFSLQPLEAPLAAMLQMQAQMGAAPPFIMQQLLDLFKISLDASVQRKDDHILSHARFPGARSVNAFSVLYGAPLTAEDFAPIPRDASVGGALSVRLSRATQDLLLPLKASPLTAPLLERFEAATGLSLEDDLLPALGDTLAFYTTTSAFTPVMALRVGDAAAMRRVMAGLIGAANEQLTELVPPEGPASYVRLRHSDVNGVDVVSLLFPGLPAPLAPTAALVDDWLLVSLTPEAISGAVDQLRRHRPSLASLPAVQRTLASRPLVGYVFSSESNIAAGYGLSTLLASAFANAVRSPVDPTREPGLLLPPLEALTKDALPAEQLTFWEGDDLVVQWRSPASVAQRLSMTMGVVARSAGLAMMQGALSAAASLPQMLQTLLQGRSRIDHLQRAVKDTRPLFEIATAMAHYAHEHKGRYPKNFQDLVDGGYAQADLLDSAIDWAGDGQGDFFIRFGGVATTPPNPARLLAYSRAAYATGDTVPVVFEDGAPRLLSLEEFLKALANPVNKDVDWRLPRRVRDKEPDFMLRRLGALFEPAAPHALLP